MCVPSRIAGSFTGTCDSLVTKPAPASVILLHYIRFVARNLAQTWWDVQYWEEREGGILVVEEQALSSLMAMSTA